MVRPAVTTHPIRPRRPIGGADPRQWAIKDWLNAYLNSVTVSYGSKYTRRSDLCKCKRRLTACILSVMKTGKRAAKYKRISADREGRELGVARQDEDLNGLAERRGLHIVGDYTDNDISASTASRKARPQYNQILRDAREGKFDVILAYTSGRLTRRPREHEDLIELAIQYGTTFEYVRSPSFDLNTSAGRRVARILAANDAGEAEDIAERVQRAKQQAAAAGKWRGGRRPFGYEADGVTARADEAAELLRASERFLRGDSVRSIAAALNARGITTTLGRPWTLVSVRQVLTRARNAGYVEHEGQIVAPAEWPAIVPEDVWRAVCSILRDPDRRTHLSNVRVRPGAGLYRCGVCDQTVMTGTTRGRIGERWGAVPAYRCRTGKHVCRYADMVDEVVDDFVVARLSRPDAIRLLRPQRPDLARFYLQEKELRRRLDEQVELHAEGVLTKQDLVRGTVRVREQLAELEQVIADSATGSAFEDFVGFPDVDRRWAAAVVDRKRLVIDTLVTVTLVGSSMGRPPGWQPGQTYFRPELVQIRPKDLG